MAYAALVERTVALPRRKVYERLADFGAVAKLLSAAIASVSVEGSGIGMIRKLTLKDAPGEVWERLEALIDQQFVSYSMLKAAALPVEHYHAMVELSDASNGGCSIRWGSNWFAKGAPAADVQAMLVGLYNGIIDGVVALG